MGVPAGKPIAHGGDLGDGAAAPSRRAAAVDRPVDRHQSPPYPVTDLPADVWSRLPFA